MKKLTLILIIGGVLLLLILGSYFLFAGYGTNMVAPAKNPTSTQTTTTPASSGLKTQVLAQGSGVVVAKKGDKVTINYIGYIGADATGKVFNSTYKTHTPFTFTLGQNKVLPVWEAGIPGMKVGEKRRLIATPILGYGAKGFPPMIPPNATLTFDIELMEIN
jgi:FK506-binding protein 1